MMCNRGLLALLLMLSISGVAFAQKDKDKKKPQPQGTPVLWQEPIDIATRNLLLGPGGESMKPDLSTVTFVKDEGGGYSTNYRIKDGAGRVWVAKIGKEAQPETAAVRLMWAVGYATEINYLVPCLVIPGAPEVSKGTVEKCEGNGYKNVKLEARPAEFDRLDNWSWSNNQFASTREFKGMLVLMSLMNNWDLKDDNNKVVFVPAGVNGRAELRYIISDLGATFGKTGGLFSRNRNAPEDYGKTKFVEGIEGRRVKLSYGGKNSGLFKNITVEDAKWIGSWLAKLSDNQISDAFKAANYSPTEVTILTRAVRDRINQLTSLPG
ncbi:MAG TPA: hypothetical protein VJ023_22080 [Pyrinomonadaceae bacterium]|nr:hypothetical protein [Pyrinomonadaceae bacterium]